MDRILVGGKEALLNAPSEDLEKGNGVVDASKFGWDAHPPTEGAPLLTRGGILLIDRRRKPLGNSLPCII